MKSTVSFCFLLALVHAVRSKTAAVERRKCKYTCTVTYLSCHDDDCNTKKANCDENCDKKYIKMLAVKKQDCCKSLCNNEDNEDKSKCLSTCDQEKKMDKCQLKCAVATEVCIKSNERKKKVDREKGISDCYADEAKCYTGSICKNEIEFSFHLRGEAKGECQRNSTKCDDDYIKKIAGKKMTSCQRLKKITCDLAKTNCKLLHKKSDEECKNEESKCLGVCEKDMKKNVCKMKCEAETGKCTEGKKDAKRIDRANRLSQCYDKSSVCHGKCL